MSRMNCAERFLADALAEQAAAGRPFRPSSPGVIMVVLDHSGGLAAAREFSRASAVGAAGSEALRSALDERALVLAGPLDRAVVILFDSELHSADDLVTVTLDLLTRPIAIEGEEHFVQSRVGLATATNVGSDALDVLGRAAFAAAHVAMETGVQLHEATSSLLSEIRLAADLRTSMARAIDEDFELHYQPIVDLATTRILGYESLLRWRSGDDLLAPAAFLAAAEETSLILPIGRAGTRTALGKVAEWNEGGSVDKLFMSVNYSARQLSDALLFPHIERVLERVGVSPSTLWVEITERHLVDLASPATRTIEALADLGCVICVDDLGTGFAALRYLADLPVSVVKVDRSLVCSASDAASIRSVVGAVCDISHSLGIMAVAEGVESENQIPMLRDLGFTHAQGYYFGRPAPAAEIAEGRE
ncbi:EAL domain-containing protein [Dietzia cercidiphylli]|uniref:EAL domain-containing protein n=1 Tax=Dietzia cercidiphylli TaxID=498199 RepID=UPI003F810548